MPIIHFDQATFRSNYNRLPFLIRHELAGHPSMQLSKLLDLALRMDRTNVLYRVGDVPVDTDFDRAHLNHPPGQSLERAVAQIGQAGVAITINTPEKDPEYRPIIDAILEDIRACSESIDPGMNWSAAYIFIAAPGSLTPYHMDREMNFLLHVQGRKVVQLWDPHDTDVMSEVEIDRLFGAYVRPRYKQAVEYKARTFELEPGTGLHHPFIAPHLVRSGSDVAVSLAVTYRTRGSDRLSALHRMNHHLRRFGMVPVPPGASRFSDSWKMAAFWPALTAARLARRLSGYGR
jgi:hypothetical protein